MALTRERYRRLPDLYVEGAELVLKDGTVIWLQVLNPMQADEARHDAQVARSRLVMALKDHGSDEMGLVEVQLWHDGPAAARKRLVDEKTTEAITKVMEALQNDAEWTERLQILDRTDEDAPLEATEMELVAGLRRDYVGEIQRRLQDEEAYWTAEVATYADDVLRDEYCKLYIDHRGAELATGEYRIVEVWYGARVCAGVLIDGVWDHAGCEGHALQVFESKADVRALPEGLSTALGEGYDQLQMKMRDAKDLARLASSSDSSRQPNAEAESTPSIPVVTPSDAPGTSLQPSLTPSPS